jgi:hypothetical protein
MGIVPVPPIGTSVSPRGPSFPPSWGRFYWPASMFPASLEFALSRSVELQNLLGKLVAGLDLKMDPRPIDYSVFASRTGAYPGCWSWQIRRKSKPIGIKLSEDGFQSESSALFARKRALKNHALSGSRRDRHPKIRPAKLVPGLNSQNPNRDDGAEHGEAGNRPTRQVDRTVGFRPVHHRIMPMGHF